MNIHLPAILGFTRGTMVLTCFDPSPAMNECIKSEVLPSPGRWLSKKTTTDVWFKPAQTWHKNRHVSQFKTCCLTGSFWALLEQDDQDSAFSCRDGLSAAFLQPQFDHKASLAAAEESGVEGAEARQMLVSFRFGGSKMFYVLPCSTQ